MVRAEFVSKSGLKISIEGSSEEIGDFLSFMERRERREEERKQFFERMRQRREDSIKKRNKLAHEGVREIKLTDVLEELIKKNFFDEPKKIRQIMIKLRHEGIHAPSSTIHPLLSRLVTKERLIREKGNEGIWEYKKR